MNYSVTVHHYRLKIFLARATLNFDWPKTTEETYFNFLILKRMNRNYSVSNVFDFISIKLILAKIYNIDPYFIDIALLQSKF